MPEDVSRKVISIFSKHKCEKSLDSDENVIKCEDGICCVCIKKDKHGNDFVEKQLLEGASSHHYIVKVMTNQSDAPYIYNYKVPGGKLLDFLAGYCQGVKEGQVIEVDKYAPNELA